MNESFLKDEDLSGLQSVEAIQAILQDAQRQGPGRYSFADADKETYDDIIDGAILDELNSEEVALQNAGF